MKKESATTQRFLEKELSVKEILKKTISLYANNAIVFLCLYIIVAIIIGLLNIFSLSTIGFRLMAILQSTNEISTLVQTQIIILIALLILFSMISNLVYAIRDSSSVLLTSNCLISASCDLKSTISFVLPKMTSLFLAELLISVITDLVSFLVFREIVITLTAGISIMLIVDFSLALIGIVILVILLFTVPAIVLENRGFLASLSRSKALVSYNFSKTFLIWLLNWSISSFTEFINKILWFPFDERIAAMLSQILLVVISPIFTISITLLYYSMLSKEQELKRTSYKATQGA